MNKFDVMYSSSKTDWETPQALFDKLNEEFSFNTDVCATTENAKCEHFYSPEDDGLEQDWRGVCWMNPPHGRDISRWMKKAYEESLKGATVVCLTFARTDTKWWHEYAMKAAQIRFIKGRVRFEGADSSAPFPSVIIVFRPPIKHWITDYMPDCGVKASRILTVRAWDWRNGDRSEDRAEEQKELKSW